MTWAKVVVSFAVMATFVGILCTQETGQKKQGGKTPAEPKPPTYKVEKKPFKIELTVKGMLDSEETAEISYRPHLMVNLPPSQGPLTIRKVLAHGTAVKKGDVLVVFDSTKLDEVIDDLEKQKKNSEASLRLAEEELPLFEKSQPVDLASTEAAKKRADEELKYFLDIGKAHMEKEVEMYVRMAKFFHEYAEEELRQLEKMYKANDLTEDTEKIILRRYRERVEQAAFYYKSALIERDYVLKHTLPHREQLLKEDQVKQDLQFDKTRKTQALTLLQKQLNLVRMRNDRDKDAARLEKLKKDRAAMTVVAPIDGIVYHGRFARGRWSGAESMEGRLVPHGTVQPDEVFMTVVKAGPVFVHLTVDEKDVHLLKPGLEGKAKLLVNPDRKLPARVAKVSSVPESPGKFEAKVTLDRDADNAVLMPGMACSVKFVPYSKKEALVIPTKSLHEEDDRFFVDVLAKDGKHTRREVTPGRADGDNTEILNGLQEGEEILLDRPAKKSSDKDASPDKDKGVLP
jgi:multidrug efflux pump subunit AcrA (membrane-fusion protein)